MQFDSNSPQVTHNIQATNQFISELSCDKSCLCRDESFILSHVIGSEPIITIEN